MKTKIICTLILFTFFSCKKDKTTSYKEELAHSIEKKIVQELKADGSTLMSIKLVKFDTLTEQQEAQYLINYSGQRLIILNRQQQQLTNELARVKNKDDFMHNESRYAKVKDSIKNELKIIKVVENLNPRKVKTGNYQAIFILKVHDKKSNTVKNDSLFMYTNDKKVIFTQAQFIEQCILKFKKG